MQLQVELEKTEEIMCLKANKERKKVLLMFRTPDPSKKIKCWFFSSSKQRNKVFCGNLDCKLQQDSYA